MSSRQLAINSAITTPVHNHHAFFALAAKHAAAVTRSTGQTRFRHIKAVIRFLLEGLQ